MSSTHNQATGIDSQRTDPYQAAGKSSRAAAGSERSRGRNIISSVLRSADLRRALPTLLVSSFLANILALALPLAILLLMDKIIVNKAYETLVVLLAGVALALFLEEVLRLLNVRVTAWLGSRFEHNQSVGAMNHLLRVPLRVLRRDEPGVHANRLLSTSQVSDFYSGQALLVIFDLPFILIFLGLIWFIGGLLALVPVLLLLIFILIALVAGRRMKEQVKKRNGQDERRHNFLNETIRGIHSVKLLGMERLMQRRYERLQEQNVSQGSKLAYGNAMASSMGQTFTKIMIVSVITFGAYGVISGDMTPGGLAACMMLSVRSLQPLRRSLSVWMRYQAFTDSNERLDTLKSLPAEKSDSTLDLPEIRNTLELKSIGLARDEEKTDYLFRELNLHVPMGSCVVLQGASGTGKSSLLSLINGDVRPDHGQVLVDGRPLTDFNPDSIHKRIAILPQHGQLFSGTIMENMTLFDDGLNEKAMELSRRLGLDRLISGMRLGYDTPVGDGLNQTLPAGVSQRVAIIRALLPDPQVVLFDETNISLDVEGDRHLREYLVQEKGSKTIILVTHRPSLLSLADEIFTLRDKKLVRGRAAIKDNADDCHDGISCAPHPDQGSDHPRREYLDVRSFFQEQSDLGMCLNPLLKSLGWQGSAQELSEALPHMHYSLDITGLRTVMASLGFEEESFRGRLKEIDHRLLPCLFVPAGHKALVVQEQMPDGRLRVYDSRKDSETVMDPSNLKGDIFYYRARKDRPEAIEQGRGVARELLSRFKWHIALTFVISIISTLLFLAAPLYVRAIYNRVLPTGDMFMGYTLLAGVIIALVLSWYLVRFKARLIAYMSGRAEYIIGNAVFQRLLALPLSATGNSSSARQFMRLKSFENMREVFLGPLAILAFDLPPVLILIAVLGIFNPMALPVLGISALLFIILGLSVHGFQKRNVQNSSQKTGQRWEFLIETLNNARSLRSVGAAPLWTGFFRDKSGDTVHASFKTHWLNAKVAAAARFIGMLTGISVLGVAVVAVIQGKMSTGALIATLIIVWRVVGPMQNALMAVGSLSRVTATFRQLNALMRMPSEDEGGIFRTRRPEVQGRVSFSRVSFRYSNDSEPALLGVTFSVPAGRMVAIAGPNGAGKSTILKLIARANTPQAGAIRLDNVDLRQIPVADLRSRISYMPQTCELYYGSIAQNLRLAHPVASSDEIEWALDMAGLTRDVKELPSGIHTRISESMAEELPNGFRQRLSLARTILKPAPVVLMDEPGNGMDDLGDRAVVRCLNYLKGRSTVFLVSNRPSHLRMAHAAIYLEGGVVRKIGSVEQINEIVTTELNK